MPQNGCKMGEEEMGEEEMGEKETDRDGSNYKESFVIFFIIIIHVRFLADSGMTHIKLVCRKSLFIGMIYHA
jgi:hypothetical protein